MSSPDPTSFTVGRLAFRIEHGTGMLRDIRYQGCEALRAIYPAVRDTRWATPAPTGVRIVQQPTASRFALGLSARVTTSEIDLEWTADIEVDTDGALRYTWRGHALRTFDTNRTGLCILHPAEAAGKPCTVEHADGTNVSSWFPKTISPHQPFTNIRAITHVLPSHAEVSVRMEGDIFEMEDQRNWSDASFKTYCRPLAWPRPYRIEAGALIEHVASVTLHGTPIPRNGTSHRIKAPLVPSSRKMPLPQIGFTLPGPVPKPMRVRLRALRPAHLRIETTPAQLEDMLAWASAEADACSCDLQVVIIGATCEPVARSRFPAGCTLDLLDPAGNAVDAPVIAAWREAGFERIATGTRHNFAELNRGRPPASAAHALTTFGINAQVHAFDDASLLETLTQHAILARQARAIGAGRPVCVAPIILGPSADTPDPRLRTEFAVLWVISCLAQLATADTVERATFFQTHGTGGILTDDTSGIPTPLERFLAELASAHDASALDLQEFTVLPLAVLLLTFANEQRLLVANPNDSLVSLSQPLLRRRVEVAPRSVAMLPVST